MTHSTPHASSPGTRPQDDVSATAPTTPREAEACCDPATCCHGDAATVCCDEEQLASCGCR